MPVRVVVGRGRFLLAARALEARGTDTAQLPQPGQEGASAPVQAVACNNKCLLKTKSKYSLVVSYFHQMTKM